MILRSGNSYGIPVPRELSQASNRCRYGIQKGNILVDTDLANCHRDIEIFKEKYKDMPNCHIIIQDLSNITLRGVTRRKTNDSKFSEWFKRLPTNVHSIVYGVVENEQFICLEIFDDKYDKDSIGKNLIQLDALELFTKLPLFPDHKEYMELYENAIRYYTSWNYGNSITSAYDLYEDIGLPEEVLRMSVYTDSLEYDMMRNVIIFDGIAELSMKTEDLIVRNNRELAVHGHITIGNKVKWDGFVDSRLKSVPTDAGVRISILKEICFFTNIVVYREGTGGRYRLPYPIGDLDDGEMIYNYTIDNTIAKEENNEKGILGAIIGAYDSSKSEHSNS